jgi:transposase InsO family protein
MKKSRFSEHEIIAILKEADAGMKVKDVCRQHGITEVLNMNLFFDLDHAQAITDEWLVKYNGERPHESLGNLTPWEFSEKLQLPTEVPPFVNCNTIFLSGNGRQIMLETTQISFQNQHLLMI